MAVNVTYLFGAGASANALPVVRNLTDRFGVFCDHFLEYLTRKKSQDLNQVKEQQETIISNLKKHYTADTYAKKLFLQNPVLHTNKEYNLLVKYLSAYFIYEQLDINTNLPCNNYLDRFLGYTDTNTTYHDNVRKIITNFDYRYDSFLASILKHGEQNELEIPEGFNFISWNYDFQFEKAYMNFSGGSLAHTMMCLNIIGTPQKPYDDSANPHLIKLNGSGGFLEDGKFHNLFDFAKDDLCDSIFEIFEEILISGRGKYKNAIRFAWEENKISKQAIELAQQKISEAAIIVVIGYSFPYFNREVDRKIFKDFIPTNRKVYIQAHEDDIDSIVNRFEAIVPDTKAIPYTELDQFLIPNEL